MLRPARLGMRAFRILQSPRSSIPSLVAPSLVEPSVLVDEEQIPGYDASAYYPMRLGELLNDRYEVVT